MGEKISYKIYHWAKVNPISAPGWVKAQHPEVTRVQELRKQLIRLKGLGLKDFKVTKHTVKVEDVDLSQFKL